MKSWMWVLIAGVLVVVIAALFIMRPTPVQAPAETPLPSPKKQVGAEFLHMEPDFVAPSVSPSPTTPSNVRY